MGEEAPFLRPRNHGAPRGDVKQEGPMRWEVTNKKQLVLPWTEKVEGNFKNDMPERGIIFAYIRLLKAVWKVELSTINCKHDGCNKKKMLFLIHTHLPSSKGMCLLWALTDVGMKVWRKKQGKG